MFLGLGALCAPWPVLAQGPGEVHAEEAAAPEGPRPPDLTRNVSHKQIGDLLLPFDWVDSPLPDGLRLISPADAKGASTAIELAFQKRLPPDTTLEQYFTALIAEVQAESKDVRVLVQEDYAHKQLKGRRAELLLEEGGFLMHYLLLAMPWREGILIVTLGAPTARYDATAPEALLFAIIDAIK
jgi:hypothetical protein